MWLPIRLMDPEAVVIGALSYNKVNNCAPPLEGAHTTPGECSQLCRPHIGPTWTCLQGHDKTVKAVGIMA